MQHIGTLCTHITFCLLLGLVACGSSSASGQMPLPTAAFAPTSVPPTAAPPPTSIPPTTASQPVPSGLVQYRVWMEEARLRHPYPEAIDKMWAVMLCESKASADMIAYPYHGLFQYHPDTWNGEWNPYRTAPILDPQAQIFATAKAWQDGYQGWWGCYALT
jgi:hypothetical protein